MKRHIWLFFPLAVIASGAARADVSLHELQPLSFGSIMKPDGTAGQTVTVATDGTVTSSGITLMNQRGSYGVYELEGYPGNAQVAITIADDTMTPLVAGTSFDVVNFDTLPSCSDLMTPCMMDPDGKLQIRIGGTLRTQAGTYNSGPYRGTYTLMINLGP